MANRANKRTKMAGLRVREAEAQVGNTTKKMETLEHLLMETAKDRDEWVQATKDANQRFESAEAQVKELQEKLEMAGEALKQQAETIASLTEKLEGTEQVRDGLREQLEEVVSGGENKAPEEPTE